MLFKNCMHAPHPLTTPKDMRHKQCNGALNQQIYFVSKITILVFVFVFFKNWLFEIFFLRNMLFLKKIKYSC